MRYAFPVPVCSPEAILRVGVVLIGGQAVPAHCLGVVRRDANTDGVNEPEGVLRPGVALFE